jgi:hypothetical protein
MAQARRRTFEFTIVQTTSYKIIGEGASQFEAEQEAIEIFRGLNYLGRAYKLDKISKPRAVKAREITRK